MRISDWSSDVCSSDLRARGFIVGRELTGGRREVRRGPSRCRVHVVRPRRDVPLFGLRAGLQVDIEKVGQPFVDDEVVSDFQQFAVLEQLVAAADGELRVRSEEHTSELQSLIRIYYSVFCLEKKI